MVDTIMYSVAHGQLNRERLVNGSSPVCVMTPLFISLVGDAPYAQERQSVDGASGLRSEVRLDMMMNGVGADDDAVPRPRHRSTEHLAGVNGELAGVRYHWAMPF